MIAQNVRNVKGGPRLLIASVSRKQELRVSRMALKGMQPLWRHVQFSILQIRRVMIAIECIMIALLQEEQIVIGAGSHALKFVRA